MLTLDSELVSPATAAEYLGVKEQTLALWRCTGRYSLPYVRCGRLVRYRQRDLYKWLESRTVCHSGEAE